MNLSQLAGRWLIDDVPLELAAKREIAFKALQQEGGSVLLVGPRGTGKTQLALELVARMCLDCLLPEPKEMAHVLGVRPFIAYWVFEELLAAEKAGWNQKGGILEEPIKSASMAELLVLDEVQERGEGAWEDRQFTVLFDKRYREMRRTIMIANLEPGALDGRLPASILSRMSEIGVVVECRWPSFRGAS